MSMADALDLTPEGMVMVDAWLEEMDEAREEAERSADGNTWRAED